MTTVKRLAIVALLVGGTSLSMAQNGPPTGAYPPIAGGAGGNPATSGPPGPGFVPGASGPTFQSTAPSPYLQSAAPLTGTEGARIAAQPRHHKNMYMSTRSTKSHKGSKLTPASNANPQMKQ
jgi:hypothetical protein